MKILLYYLKATNLQVHLLLNSIKNGSMNTGSFARSSNIVKLPLPFPNYMVLEFTLPSTFFSHTVYIIRLPLNIQNAVRLSVWVYQDYAYVLWDDVNVFLEPITKLGSQECCQNAVYILFCQLIFACSFLIWIWFYLRIGFSLKKWYFFGMFRAQ